MQASSKNGIDRDRIANAAQHDSNIKHLECSICLSVVWKPVCCKNCDNYFCDTCITQWVKTNDLKQCPNRCTFVKGDVPRIIRSLLSELKIKCRYEGCQEVVGYEQLEKHETDCGFRRRKCIGCNLFYNQSLLSQHQEICELIKEVCKVCKEEFLRKDMKIHTELICLQNRDKQSQNTIEMLKEIIRGLKEKVAFHEKNKEEKKSEEEGRQ